MDLNGVTLHQLRIFRAVARRQSLTRAAEELCLSQPAVSVQLRQLERAVGLPLFDQVGRGLQITESGRIVEEYARRVLDQMAELGDVVTELQGLARGRLVVAADTTVGIYVMPRLLGQFHEQCPTVEIDLRVGNHESVRDLLYNNEPDLAVVGHIPDLRDLDVEPFLPNRLVVVAPPGHRLALSGHRPLPPHVVAAEPFLAREAGSSTRAAAEAFFAQAGLRLHVAMQLGSIGAIKQGVASGLGLAVVSERAIANELAVGQLVTLEVEGFPIERNWFIVHHHQKRLSPAAQHFKAFLRASRPQFAHT